MNAETKAKISAALTGRPKTPEHCRKLSEAASRVRRGRPSDTTIEKIRQGNLGKKKRPRTIVEREIQSERMRESWERRKNGK